MVQIFFFFNICGGINFPASCAAFLVLEEDESRKNTHYPRISHVGALVATRAAIDLTVFLDFW